MAAGANRGRRNAKRRLAILAQGLRGGGGVTRFIHGLLRELDQADPAALDWEVFVVTDGELPALEHLQTLVLARGTFPGAGGLSLLRLLAQGRFDAVLYPKTTIPLTHLAFGFDKLIVVHDLVYYEKAISEYGPLETARYKLLFPISLRCSDRCFAVSHATRRDVQARFGWYRRCIPVCHASVPDRIRPTADDGALAELGVRRPYLFYCGSLSPRKNLLRVLQAFHMLRGQADHCLYISSNASWRDAQVLSYLRRHLGGRAFLLGRLRDDQLTAMYSHADALVYVSLYEGFGMPILEAQACGCPVITSSQTSCPEVAGEGALFVDAEDVSAIAKGMLQVLTSPDTRAQLRARGFDNVRRYSWRRTVDVLLSRQE